MTIHTRFHSPLTFRSPRSKNCRKPSTALMIPKTGSTEQARLREVTPPSRLLSLSAIATSTRSAIGLGGLICSSERNDESTENLSGTLRPAILRAWKWFSA